MAARALRRTLLAGCLLTAPALALGADEPLPATIPVQPLQTESSAADEKPATTGALETVLVTARRRQERAIDVPISLAVLDGEKLGEAGLTLATDIQERVPGLLVSVPNPRLTSYTIRGLGSSSANDGIESSVGLFLDGVYLGRQGLSIFDLVDLDRVEVLRGPQGTLFGKNTTAGAINIVTKAPMQTFEAALDASAGNLGYRQLRGSVNGGLLDTLAGRLTGYLSRRDGLITNLFDGGKLNARDKQGLRGQLLWTPTGTLSGRFIAEYGRTHEVCCAYPLVGPIRKAVADRDAYMEYQRASLDAADRVADSDGQTHADVQQKALSAEFNWEISTDHRLTAISAWRDWHFLPVNDDATSLDLVQTSTLNEHRQLSQELRLDSRFEGFDSVVGLYYLRQDFEGRERITLGEDLGGWVFGGLIHGIVPVATISNTGPVLYALIPPETLAGTVVTTPYSQTTDSAAAFASIDWHLSERLDLTTGLRYTYEWKEAAVSRSRSGGNPGASPLSLTDNLSPLGQLIGVDLAGLTFGGLLDSVAGGDFARADERAEGDFSGQVSLSWKLAPDRVTYASVARGYKGGGINLGVTGASVKPTFEPEEATSFEVGAKGQFLARRLTSSIAVYQTDVRDYQALTFDDEMTLLPNPRQTNLLNVGRVRLRGVEFDAFGYAGYGLLLRAGAAYSRAITTDFKNAPDEDTRGNDKDLSGKTLYNAPRWTATAGAEQSLPLTAALQAYGGLDYSYRSSYYATVERGRASFIEAYSIVNARLGLRADSRAWDLSLWVRNLLDEDYIASIYPLYGVGDYGGFAGDPRTYGVTLRANFD